MSKKRILIFIVAYNHEQLIESVLSRIPEDLAEHDTEILIIDDASQDRTFETAERYKEEHKLPYKITVLVNPKNQRYGGNQKIGFHYSIEHDFDILALVHGDGQYAPEALPKLLAPIISGEVDAVMGSRMADRFGALKGGMPLYKYVGNKILTTYQNFMLDTDLYEFHTGYRLYDVAALKRIPFDLVTNEFHFDNEIYIQLLLSGERVREIGIDTFYGDEICNVDGFRYAWDIVKTTAAARLRNTSLFYHRKYDLPIGKRHRPEDIPSKLGFESSHAVSVDAVPAGARVMIVGVDGGYVARALKDKGCHITGYDDQPEPEDSPFDAYTEIDFSDDFLPETLEDFDWIVFNDSLGRFRAPELFMESFAQRARLHPDLKILVTNGNVTFLTNRLLVLIGRHNYSKRGILSHQHPRLFTFASMRNLFETYGFEVDTLRAIPAPFPLLFGHGLGKALLGFNRALIYVSKGLFGYQMILVAKPRPALAWLLSRAEQEAGNRQKNPRT
jgi:glycosyltransferase involved in cell wall biosynthesis